MMTMSGRVTSCCVTLLLALTCVSAVQKKINSINDLKDIGFGQSVPKHSLLLLYWFANQVHIDNVNVNVMWLTFDPDDRDYGSHHYGNFEGILDPLPYGHRYYTIGSLNQDTSTVSLPSYVTNPPRAEYGGRNRDRIIVSIRDLNRGQRVQQRIVRVYLTQHYDNMGEYDPDNTYEISTNLLRQIREFSVGQNQWLLQQLRDRFSGASNSELENIRARWGQLAGLGLLLFIVINERYRSNTVKYRLQSSSATSNTQPDFFGSVPQTRQYHQYQHNNTDNDTSFICTVVAVVLLLLFFLLIVIQGNSQSGRRW